MPFLGPRDYFAEGQWNAICQQCGLKRKSGEIVLRWDGLMVCKTTVNPGCWEPRQPQDFVRGVKDEQAPPWTRPDSEPEFVDMATRPDDVLTDDPQ
jgi:hypothetical protein